MRSILAARQPPMTANGLCRGAMRSQFLIGVRRWAVNLPQSSEAGLNVRRDIRTKVTSTEVYHNEVPELLLWVQRKGGQGDGATLANLAGRDGGAGWGLKASEDAESGERLILLPASCQLTYSDLDDPRLLRIISRVPDELWGAKLALQLLAQRVRGVESTFAAYIANLPKGIQGIPMFFSKRAIDLIDYPPVTQQVHKRCKWLYSFSTQHLAALPGTSEDPFNGIQVDINALGWAMACVSSRAFRTRGANHPAAMLPLIDMANHSFTPNAEVLPLEGGSLGLFAKRKVSAGEPLLLSYGKLSNDFLFMDYGFIIPDNPYDTVQLRFDPGLLQAGALVASLQDPVTGAPRELVPLAPWQSAALEALRLSGPSADTKLLLMGRGGGDCGAINLNDRPPVDTRLLAAARVMVAEREGELVGRGPQRLSDLDKPLSLSNELAALRVVAGVVAMALSNFKTSLDQDQEALEAWRQRGPTEAQGMTAGGDQVLSSDDEALAVQFRVEKKRLLARCLRWLAERRKAVVADSVLREHTGEGPTKKGSKPVPATSKGFGNK